MYLFFASSLVDLRKDLRNVCAFGTDGEEALADAFSHEFTLAVQLTCFIHKRRNIEAKLKENGFSTECQQWILDDIFGKCRGGTMFEGLVDSVDVSVYNQKLEMLEEAWSKLDADRGKVFHQWFMKYEYHIFKDTMLKPVREKAGLGSPPLQFSTNTSECVNAILKQKVECKRNELPVFIQKLKELVSDRVRKSNYQSGKFQIKRLLQIYDYSSR